MPRTQNVTLLPGLPPLVDGRTVSLIARRIGVSQGTLSRIIAQKSGASLDVAWRLAKHLGTSIEDLMVAPAPAQSAPAPSNPEPGHQADAGQADGDTAAPADFGPERRRGGRRAGDHRRASELTGQPS